MQQALAFRDTSASGRAGPILVTGSHRSGSTWVGNILALAPGTGYVHEPFNVKTRAGICDARFPTDLTYVTAENEAAYLPALRDTLSWRYALGAELRSIRTPRDAARTLRDYAYFATKRRQGARIVMKDPIALFSAEWLSDRFDMPVVVLIRHPAAFVASLIAAGWVKFPFAILLRQDGLMRDRLEPFRGDLVEAAERPPDPVGVGILLWRVMHHHIRLLRRDRPDWIFVRHEDLSRDPTREFRALYGRLGLVFTDRVEEGVNSYSESDRGLAALSIFGVRRRIVRDSKGNVKAFRQRLGPEQIARIRENAADVWPDFYEAADW